MKTDRMVFFGTSGLFLLVLLFGGGGAPAPFAQALLESLGMAWLLLLLWLHLFRRQIVLDGWIPVAMLLLILAIPAAHMVPLPYSIWSSLPGRGPAVQALQLAGIRPGSLPFSLSPEGTRQAGMQLIVAAAILFGVLALPRRRRMALVDILIAVAMVSAIIGALQFSMPGTRALYIFPRSIFTTASGLFANRNFQSDFLLIAIMLAGFRIRLLTRSADNSDSRRTVARVLAFLVIPFMAFAVVATLSRTGFLLVLPVLLAAYVIGFGVKVRRELLWLAAVAAIGGAVAVLFPPEMLSSVIRRFDRMEELRVQVLSDLIFATQVYSPAGSGIGTFDPVYRAVESLSVLRPSYLNHAHDDYIEIAIEAGWVGLAITGVFILLFVWTAIRVWMRREKSAYVWLQRTAVPCIALVLVHSAVDYPLRTMTLQAVMVLLTVVLFSKPVEIEGPEGNSKSTIRANAAPRPLKLGVAIALVAAGLLSAKELVMTGLGQSLADARFGQLAYRFQPNNDRAAALAAGEMLDAGDPSGAERLALRAVSRSPFDVVAVRALGEARNRRQPGSGDGLLLLAGRLSWRDRPTQAWLLRQAALSGEVEIAMQRAEAIVRLEGDSDLAFGILRYLASTPDSRAVLARSLARRPFWRSAFLGVNSTVPSEQLIFSAAILRAMAGTTAPPTLIEAAATIDGLGASGRWDEAYRLYADLFPHRAASTIGYREDFQKGIDAYRPQGNSTVFDWQLSNGGQGGASIDAVPGEAGNQAVFAYSDGSSQPPLLRRALRLPPGRYALQYRLLASRRDAPSALRWSVSCVDGRELAQSSGEPVDEGRWSARSLVFEVPSGCSTQRAVLEAVPPEDRNVREAYFEGIELRRQ